MDCISRVDGFTILKGGSFIQAIIDNDLEEAIGRADDVAIRGLKLFVLVNLWLQIER